MIRRIVAVLSVVVTVFQAQAEGRDASRVYVFGNSLQHHLSDADHTNIVHWMNEMARADGRTLALDGQWGFLRNFADGLPPTDNWSFPGIAGAWSPGDGAFGEAGYDAVILTPSNFVQYQPPDAPYDGENPTGESPLGATLRLVDWLSAEAPDARLFLYEGWAVMDGIVPDFPPDGAAFARYVDYNGGAHAAWFDRYQALLAEARPDTQPQLIPTARILAALLGKGGPLADVPATALFTDADPHGTPSLYFLAGMITFAAVYDAAPPVAYQPPATLLPEIVANYPALAQTVWSMMPEPRSRRATVPAAGETSPVKPQARPAAATLPQRQPVYLPPPGARPDGAPALGMGLGGIADWNTQHPFIDVMRSARGWVGHRKGQWGGYDSTALRDGGYLNDDGWPVGLPDDAEMLEAIILTDQPDGALHLAGDYAVIWEGTGELTVGGRAKRVRQEEGRITFNYTPGDGYVGVQVRMSDPDDPIRNIRVVHVDHWPLFETGAIFNPDWIERVRDLRVVRFMDWMMTNGSTQVTWDDRPTRAQQGWSERGVPVEVMIALANQIGADPWFTLPHMADDDYARRFAEAVRDGLDPRLKAYVEYSNEVWNQIFPQARWAAEQATARWGSSETGWMQFYGLRAAQMMDIWSDVFGDQADSRLVRVVSTHTGWPGLEEDVLTAPLAFLELGRAPGDSFDAYAVTGYFGYEMGGAEMAADVQAWLDAAEAMATADGEAQGLRRVALREFVKENRFEAAIAPAAIALEQGSLRELVEDVFPYHAAAAGRAGLRLIMYEGGTHVVAHGDRVNDDRLTEFFTQFNYTPEMARLYELLMAGWVDAGGTLFNAFVDVAPATKWGSWGALRHLDDANPRWDMLMAFNATGPTSWEIRDPSVFSDGVVRRGQDGPDTLTGTPEEDILLGGPGDDLLVSLGGVDRLHGGPGRDVAELPGRRADWTLTRDGARIVATSRVGTATMIGIEVLRFSDDPGADIGIDAG
ncbi:calcium-binding protein [Thalassococcus sp. CAU 1522]|uniref:Calcium-binding protein n=1 Tax=Thalassococcus arenae TaxID=2851652 RepID=A0ABS6N6A3_9RHOB|nr:calcium-binding protein [Thalassococcus arenae]MBV2359540.1 calcium-binding protein [Thalassococcus arenae]